MAEGKNGVIVYADWIKKFESLEDAEAGKLIKHFFRYINDLNPEPPDRITALLFIDIEATLKRDLKAWEKRAERSRNNGKSGGRPVKETQKNPEEPTETHQVILEPRKPDSVSVNDTVNVSVSDINTKEGEFLIPSMCQVWYKKFPHYTKNQDNDFPAMLKILQFMTSQAGQTNISDQTVKEKILNTLEQVADEVIKNPFWVNKAISSIANNIQEFYNKIKNPQHGSHKQPSSRQAANKQSIDYLLDSINNDIQRTGEQDNRA